MLLHVFTSPYIIKHLWNNNNNIAKQSRTFFYLLLKYIPTLTYLAVISFYVNALMCGCAVHRHYTCKPLSRNRCIYQWQPQMSMHLFSYRKKWPIIPIIDSTPIIQIHGITLHPINNGVHRDRLQPLRTQTKAIKVRQTVAFIFNMQ